MNETDATAPSPPSPAAEAAPERLPANTTPTWEIELLISGVTVFALLQVPALIGDWSDRLAATQGEALLAFALIASIYTKAAATTLALTFVAHLGLRAYWIALVGLRSVYPDGIRWDTLAAFGPLAADIARRALGTPAEAIERADNRASLVFAVGVGLALVMLMLLAVIGLLVAASIGVAFASGLRHAWGALVVAATLAVVVPYVAAVALDRYRGARLGATAAKVLRATLSGYHRAGLQRFSNPLLMYFMSRVGFRRASGIFAAVLVAIIVAGMADSGFRDGSWRLDGYDYLPAADDMRARALLPSHYASTRGSNARAAGVPYVPSDVVRGDYLRLFIPYRPRRHNAALRSECPAVGAEELDDVGAEIARLDALAACLATMHPATLDGTPLAPLDLVFATDPSTGTRGMVAMIRVADLGRGRHELVLGRAPRPGASHAAEPPYRILFWR
jgi:hypothetical protein